MNDIKESTENIPQSSMIAPVGTDKGEMMTNNSKLESMDEKSGNKSENIVVESPGSVLLGPSTEVEPSDVPSKPVENGTLVSSLDEPVLHPEKGENETDLIAVAKSPDSNPSKETKKDVLDNVVIDTAAPIHSVKSAVSKFGGIVDWKAHKVQTVEKHKFVQQELDRAYEDMPIYKEQSESAEEAKNLVLKELESTKRLIEELKLNLERAHKEEQQAKEDAELAKLQAHELEEGIHKDASVAAKAQLEVARARHDTAIAELKFVTKELEQLKKDNDLLLVEKDLALEKAKEAALALKEVEKIEEELTVELLSTKELLELAHASHLEADEKKVGALMMQEQDNLNWKNELKQAEEELEKLNKRIKSSNDLKSKVDMASSLLKDLKTELGVYMKSDLNEEKGEKVEKTHLDMQEAIELAKKDLEGVKTNIKKATDEISILKVATTSLNLELEGERSEILDAKEREGMALIVVASLETELNEIKSEIAIAETKEKESREKMVNLPTKLQEATREADLAKLAALTAHEELIKATEEAEKAKVEASAIENRLLAAKKEIEAAKNSEKLALSAIKAMGESEKEKNEDTSNGVTLTLEEYYRLGQRAHEAEEKANASMFNALSQIQEAKQSQSKSLKKLDDMNRDLEFQKEDMEIAIKKAEAAIEAKLGVEQELRQWRATHVQRRKAGEIAKQANVSTENCEGKTMCQFQNSPVPVHHETLSNEILPSSETGSSPEVKAKQKKKSVFHRFLLYLKRKKAHAAKSKAQAQ